VLVAMTQVELVGRRDRLDDVLVALQAEGLAEVASSRDRSASRTNEDEQQTSEDFDIAADELRTVESSLAALVDHLPAPAEPGRAQWLDPVEVQAVLARAKAAADPLLERRNRLQEELETLPHTRSGLADLIPLVPELASLTDAELAQIHLATIAVMLDDPDGVVVEHLRAELAELLGGGAMLVAAPAGPATGCLLVMPSAAVAEVQLLLSQDRVDHLALPESFSGRSLRSTVEAMGTRIEELPGLLAAAEVELVAAIAEHADGLRSALFSVRARLERLGAMAESELTPRAFGLRLWVPVADVRRLTEAVQVAEPAAVATVVPVRDRSGEPPVLMRNPRWFRPFQPLVGFLSWPAPGGLDPTGLMAAVLPAMFGIMVGDVGYGLVLMVLGYAARRHWGETNPGVADIGRILVLGGAWATLFGVLFGELFGDFGKTQWGMGALWFYRGGADALTPLLVFVLAVGAAHLVLGLLIGIWLAIRERHLSHLMERGGTLLVLGGLFALAGTATSFLPGSALPPAAAFVVVGVVLAGVPHGPLGFLLGPIEVVGRIGNMLSYLRLAAVGLASVYLAIVANELGRQAPLLLGIIVATFFHVLNLVLAAFSPMIQALRLHYVEFFGTFHDGGGRAFRPLGCELGPAPAPDAPPVQARPQPVTANR
jgi:V/A-type H+/Na+-transporting ATPase subunit I